MQLVNYCFIIQLDGCMYSFCYDDNDVVDNLLIYLLLNFHSHSPYVLRITDVRSMLPEMLALWIDLKD